MTGQLCGRCGTALAPEGCPCGWSGSDAETAIIPVIGGPELVRPYFHPDDAELDGPEPDDGPPAGQRDGGRDGGLDGELDDDGIIDAELLDTPDPQPTRVLRAYVPAQRPAEPLGVVVTRPPQGPPPGRGRRRSRTRSTLLIGTGITVIAGIGVVAALVPQMLGGGPVQVALPQPGVTAPLPTQTQAGPTTSALPTAVATSATHAAAVVTPSPSADPSAPATPTTRPAASPTLSPSITASHGGGPATPTAGPSPSATGGVTSGTLSLGDTGPAVVTLQQDLSSIWGLDRNLRADGDYGPRTEMDVATFQDWFGVEGDPTGVYGPNTQAAMAQELAGQDDGQ